MTSCSSANFNGSDAVLEKATFAGGCFWCMESVFKELNGVTNTISGYTDGHTEDPNYEEVCSGTTGHTEAIEIYFNPKKISYQELLDKFWKNIDPTDDYGQFADKGSQYRTGIYVHNEEQKNLAEESKQALAESGIFDRPIITEIKQASIFYKAENHHQGYTASHPLKYKAYYYGSGRGGFLQSVWSGNPKFFSYNKDELSKEENKASSKYSKPSK